MAVNAQMAVHRLHLPDCTNPLELTVAVGVKGCPVFDIQWEDNEGQGPTPRLPDAVTTPCRAISSSQQNISASTDVFHSRVSYFSITGL